MMTWSESESSEILAPTSCTPKNSQRMLSFIKSFIWSPFTVIFLLIPEGTRILSLFVEPWSSNLGHCSGPIVLCPSDCNIQTINLKYFSHWFFRYITSFWEIWDCLLLLLFYIFKDQCINTGLPRKEILNWKLKKSRPFWLFTKGHELSCNETKVYGRTAPEKQEWLDRFSWNAITGLTRLL